MYNPEGQKANAKNGLLRRNKAVNAADKAARHEANMQVRRELHKVKANFPSRREKAQCELDAMK